MNKKVLLTILCLLCAAFPLAAQTAAPENMVQIPAGKFWMGRAYTIYTDSADLVPIDKLDDRPANNIYLDAFYIDKYEVTNADWRNSFRQHRAPSRRGTGLKARSRLEKKSYPFTTSIGLKRPPTASGQASVCRRKRNGKKRPEADSTGITTRGETPTSIPLKSTFRRHKGRDASTTTSPFQHTFRAQMPSLSDRSSPTAMVSMT